MSFGNNIPIGPKIDTLIQQNSNALPESLFTPPGPTQQQVPEGMHIRASGDTGLPPRNNVSLLGNDSGNVGSEVRKEGVHASSDAGDDSMRNMVEMNNMNMKFTMLQGRLSMEAKFVEGLAKTIKDTGSKVAQLAG